MRDGCYREGAKSKTYGIRILSPEHEEQIAYIKTQEYRERIRARSRVEHKNADSNGF
ncbi:hypothetical protein GCM10011571_11580 [Marinithermofilum abyssi]|uniref:Uncharacterized protein n=1 Tax=Marinithermofilum abyssi TaxID=1571185 RepID=A0A8J2VH48_9BACL|nr:hypothetical protein GCM10011571_11580 [Marinithermofilum abyssi]